jgi:hypothetical protein
MTIFPPEGTGYRPLLRPSMRPPCPTFVESDGHSAKNAAIPVEKAAFLSWETGKIRGFKLPISYWVGITNN